MKILGIDLARIKRNVPLVIVAIILTIMLCIIFHCVVQDAVKKVKEQPAAPATETQAVETSPADSALTAVPMNKPLEAIPVVEPAPVANSSIIASNIPLPAIPRWRAENPAAGEGTTASVPGTMPLPVIPRNNNVPVSSKAPATQAEAVNPAVPKDSSQITIFKNEDAVETEDKSTSDSIAYIGGDGIQFNNGQNMEFAIEERGEDTYEQDL